MGRRLGLLISLILSNLAVGSALHANCILIDTLDKLQIIQTRLARNPDTALFSSDIRQLRAMRATIGDRETLDAVDGNRFTGKGAAFIRFLQNTQDLLQGASLDDPHSVRHHFTTRNRANLAAIRSHLNDLRCTTDQIAIESATTDNPTDGTNSDAEDLAEVAETLSALADELFQWRTLVIALTLMAVVTTVTPPLRRWLILRRRRVKRHNTTYATHYLWNDREINGLLLDINCYGTKLRHEADNPIPLGQTIDVKICNDWVGGTVMWVNTHYSGLQFRRPVSLKDVEAVRTESDLAKPPSETQNGAQKDAA
jgi:hypothetical protein